MNRRASSRVGAFKIGFGLFQGSSVGKDRDIAFIISLDACGIGDRLSTQFTGNTDRSVVLGRQERGRGGVVAIEEMVVDASLELDLCDLERIVRIRRFSRRSRIVELPCR
jgi:hypothetical protein